MWKKNRPQKKVKHTTRALCIQQPAVHPLCKLLVWFCWPKQQVNGSSLLLISFPALDFFTDLPFLPPHPPALHMLSLFLVFKVVDFRSLGPFPGALDGHCTCSSRKQAACSGFFHEVHTVFEKFWNPFELLNILATPLFYQLNVFRTIGC